MSDNKELLCERFPRASQYHPEWVLAGVGGGANPLWLTEWLGEAVELRPGMKVLDLGCGRALSSIFLHREYGVQVWAADLWFSQTENIRRVRDAGVEDSVFPMRADAHRLPFSEDFFDAIVGIDSFMFFGTDDLYLNYLARFLKPDGILGVAMAGFVEEMNESIPEYMGPWWEEEKPYCLHSAEWWRRHWEQTGIVEVSVADVLQDGWKYWRQWLQVVAPENEKEIDAVTADAGRNLAYVRIVARRISDAQLFDPLMAIPAEYVSQPLLRS